MVLQAIGISLFMMLSAGFSAVTGFGTSTISIPVLLFFFPLPQTLLFVGIMRLISTLWKMFLFREKLRPDLTAFVARLVIAIGLPAAFASVMGARTLLAYTEYISMKILGVLLLIYVIFMMLRPHFKIVWHNSTYGSKIALSIISLGGGSLAGFTGGVFGISGPLQAAFLSLFNLPKGTYIFTAAALDGLIDVSRLTTYLLGGINLLPVFVLGLVFSVPAIFLGALLGKKIVHVIPQVYFRFVVILFLGVVALRWIVWG